MDCIWEVGKTYRTSVQGVTARIRKSTYFYVYGTLDFEPENAPMRKWCARTGYSAEWGGENGLAFPRIQLTRGRGCEVDGGNGGGVNEGGGEAASGVSGSESDSKAEFTPNDVVKRLREIAQGFMDRRSHPGDSDTFMAMGYEDAAEIVEEMLIAK
jgi:hypothetical protein